MKRNGMTWSGLVKRASWALSAGMLLAVLVGCGEKASSGKTVDGMLLLYQGGWYAQARAAALEHMDEPKGQLVYYLCRVFDFQNLNYEEGLDGLRKLYDDPAVRRNDVGVWAEAGLSYGRVIQVNQLRKLVEGDKGSQIPKKYDEVDVRAIFADIMEATPETAQGTMAGIYLGETYFRSDEPGAFDKGFKALEACLAGEEAAAAKLPETDRKQRLLHTVPLHLYLDIQYVDLKGDYAGSFEHLKAAFDLGIVKEILRRTTLFRMGRTCDIKLNRKREAKRYYEQFLVEYPFAKRTPLVKRYLEEMKGK